MNTIKVIMMEAVTHDLNKENLEAKALWFQSLPLAERIEMLCEFTDLVLEKNPLIAERKDAKPIAGRVRVLELPPS